MTHIENGEAYFAA